MTQQMRCEHKSDYKKRKRLEANRKRVEQASQQQTHKQVQEAGVAVWYILCCLLALDIGVHIASRFM